MGELLQKAYDAESELQRNISVAPGAEWGKEVSAAGQFYGEMYGMVNGTVGLNARRARSGEEIPERHKHEVEESVSAA